MTAAAGFVARGAGAPAVGRAAVREAVERLLAGFRTLTATPVRVDVAGEVVTFQSRLSGVTIAGDEGAFDGVDVLRFAGEQIARKDTYLDLGWAAR